MISVKWQDTKSTYRNQSHSFSNEDSKTEILKIHPIHNSIKNNKILRNNFNQESETLVQQKS